MSQTAQSLAARRKQGCGDGCSRYRDRLPQRGLMICGQPACGAERRIGLVQGRGANPLQRAAMALRASCVNWR